MSNLVICETDKGNYAVRPDDWAGIWTIDGKLKEVGFCAPAIFRRREDAEEYVRLKDFEEIGLTPERIRQIDELYTEKCKELAEERKKHEWIPADQPPNVFDEHGQSEDVIVKLEWYDADITYSIGWYSRKYGWSDNQRSVNVISWMPLPWMKLSELYKPGGKP